MKVVCGWCGKALGEKDGKGQTGDSHGICPDCVQAMLKDAAELQESTKKK